MGDSYDNAMAERDHQCLYKPELIWRLEPRRRIDALEIAALEWVD